MNTNHAGTDSTVMGLLAELRRRQRGLNTLRWGVHGVLIGAGAGCAAALVMWLAGETEIPRLLMGAGVMMALVAAVCAVWGMMAPISDLELARALDRAGKGEDRFASALQLMGDRHQERARLVVEDAVAHVRGTPVKEALPLRVPVTARWVPLPLAVLMVMLLVLPGPKTQAASAGAPEISADEWTQLADEFEKDLKQLPKPLNAEEEELQKELERLAEKLRENPEKLEALKDIARLSERVERERKTLSSREMSLKKAAKAMSKSQALKNFASKMQEGEYQDAAEELKAVAAKMREGDMAPDAEEFERLAQDLEKLAKELAGEEMEQDAQDAANAATSMNRKELAEALKRMSEQMKKNAGKYKRSDNLQKQKSMLDELKRRMNKKGQCQSCGGEGCGECEGNGNGDGDGLTDRPGNGARKGGKKAGWGSASKWDGGELSKDDDKRVGEMSDAMETSGASTTFKIVSPEEKAKSGKRYEELYAEFVAKAEADLELENVPVSQREYLRKYFKAIRPREEESEKKE